jgi:hypothetical protein
MSAAIPHVRYNRDRMRLASVLVIAGCVAAKPPPTISNRAAPTAGGLLTITEDSFGPLRPDSPATLAALRAAFTGFDVRATNDTALSYSVFLGNEKLVWIIPNDDGSLFNVHATSGRIETRAHDWRVGSAFNGSRYITHCECWGDNPTCYRHGDHIAVNFKRGCDSVVGDDAALRALDGEVVQRVIWSPKPFVNDAADEPADP